MRGRSVRTNADGNSIKEAAMEAASSVNSLYRVSHEFLEHQAKDRPYALLGAAAGIGFVLGGGLASRVAEILLSIGGRVLAAQVLETSWNNRAFDE
ncbi:MAG TPA: hypothetical protein VL137_11080 [Polyangiaceae bacterium]|nr:hypothetical protein [Polyangiaceae bacterium]